MKREMVNHPAHYGGADNPYEAIKVIEAWELDFCLGNAVKYIARAPHKGATIEDLKKALWYVARRIKQMEEDRHGSKKKRVHSAHDTTRKGTRGAARREGMPVGAIAEALRRDHRTLQKLFHRRGVKRVMEQGSKIPE